MCIRMSMAIREIEIAEADNATKALLQHMWSVERWLLFFYLKFY